MFEDEMKEYERGHAQFEAMLARYDEVIAQKDAHAQDLMLEIEKCRNNELALRATNKKLAAISMRFNDKAAEL